MRILIIGVNRPPETFIARKLAGLVESGFEVIAATTDSRSSAEGQKLGVRWVTIPKPEGIPGRIRMGMTGAKSALLHPADMLAGQQAAGNCWTLRAAAGVLAGIRPDVVHFEWNLTAVDYLPLFGWLNAPVVISCRGSQVLVAPHNPERQSATGRIADAFSRAAAVHCVSEFVKSEAVNLGLDPAKAVVIRPAVDPEIFRPRSKRASNVLRVITTGSLGWVKGPEYALLAIRHLKDAGVPAHFTWIGRGSKQDHQRFLYTMHDLKIADQVTLAGQLSAEQVRDRLCESDVFLLPSVSEGISNAALEAMACGLPVVSTKAGGMGEAIANGVEGFLVDVRDAGAMSAALQRLSDAGLRDRMGVAARRRIETNFDMNEQRELWAGLYRTVVENGVAGVVNPRPLEAGALTAEAGK